MEGTSTLGFPIESRFFSGTKFKGNHGVARTRKNAFVADPGIN